MMGQQRSSASRLLSRCSRCRIHSSLPKPKYKSGDCPAIAVAAAYPPSSNSSRKYSPPSLDTGFFAQIASHGGFSSSDPGMNQRQFSSSSFRNTMQQINQISDRESKERFDREGVGGVNTTRGGHHQTTGNNRHDNMNSRKQGHNQRPSNHSVRLINEAAARETTQLFLEAYNNSNSTKWQPRNVAMAKHNNTSAPWKDLASLLAAEQALEFWAHRNNNHHGGRKQHHKSSNRQFAEQHQQQSTLEEDAETALRLFTALHHFHCVDGHVLTNGMYSHVIDALAKSTNLDHIIKGDSLLRQFISLYIEHHSNMQKEGGLPKLLQLIEQSDCVPTNGESSKELTSKRIQALQQLKVPKTIEWSDKDNHHFPNQIRITGVMRGYARQSFPLGAESLLKLMIDLSSTGGNKRMFRPNEIGFATVIDAYSRVHDGSNAERVLQLMKKRSFDTGAIMDDQVLKEKGTNLINGANVVAYNAAISAWARSAKEPSTAGEDNVSPSTQSQDIISVSRAAANNAEALLREMWTEHDSCHSNPHSSVLPDVVTYSTVISAYATCLDQPYGMERAKKLLAELEGLAVQEYSESHHHTRCDDMEEHSTTKLFRSNGGGRNRHGFQPNTMVYNTLLQAYANAGDAPAAEAILQSMTEKHSLSLKEGGGGPFQHVKANTRTFNVVLNAWSKSNGGEGGVRASNILERMEMTDSNKHRGPQPDIVSYNTVLAAWSNSASVNPASLSKRNDSAHSTYIVGKDAAFEALKLLDKLEHQYLQSNSREYRSRAFKPDVISYNTTIAAFANATQYCEDGLSMAEKAESMLTRMKDRLGVEPDTYSYNGVLLAWARSSGGLPAAKRAENILRSMRDPTIVSWSTVIGAYAHADSAPNAAALLQEIEQNALGSFGHSKKNQHVPIIPSITLYNNVLQAWGKSSDAEASRNAEILLNHMESTPQLPGPDAISYQLVLTALERTLDPDKAERARSIMDRFLTSLKVQKDRRKCLEIQNAFNSVLTACAYTPANAGKDHRNNAARVLVATLREMNQFSWSAADGMVDGPNQESYALFIQACTHLFEANSEERSGLLRAAFHECCQKGLLNRIIWDKFCSSMRPELVKMFFEDIMPNSGGINLVKYEDLPEEWRNGNSQQ